MSWSGYTGRLQLTLPFVTSCECDRKHMLLTVGSSWVIVAYLKEATGLKCDQPADTHVCIGLLMFAVLECCMPVL